MKEKETKFYFHEDMSLKKLSELIYLYFIKDPNYEYIEARSEMEIINPHSRRADMVFKGKEKIILYEFLSVKSNLKNVSKRVLSYVSALYEKYDMPIEVRIMIGPYVEEDAISLEVCPGMFFEPKISSFKEYDGDIFLNNINEKLKNNEELTFQETIDLGIVPLMRSEYSPNDQILKTIELTRRIKNINYDLKNEILGVQVLLADRFVEDPDLKNQIMDVIDMNLDIVHDYGNYREEQVIEQGVEKVATNMLNEGYTTDQIAEVTHLDTNSIEQLKKNKPISWIN